MALRPQDLTIFDLAAGTGMFSTAVELACAAIGLPAKTICYCERDACAAASIVARMENKTLHPAPIWDDIKSLDCEPWRGQVDIVCAGYPCQGFSSAGKQLGNRDPRYLWPAVRRAIARIKPSIVFLENVEGHVGNGSGKVIRDLQRLGYRVTAGLYSSAECGASHQRKRLFILGVADRDGERSKDATASERKDARGVAADAGGTMADAKFDADRTQQRTESWRRKKAGPNKESVPGRERKELADAKFNGRQKHEWVSRGGGESHAAEINRKLANASGPGCESRRHSESQGNADPVVSGGELGHTNMQAGRCGRQANPTQRRERRLEKRSGELPRYAPARNDFAAWAAIAKLDPSKMPAIESELRRMAPRLAPWSDQLRLAGNGVDPLVAGYAFLSLSACLAE